MSDIPSELKYSKSHEWARNDDGDIVIGISDHAQSLLGDVVFVELPEVDTQVSAGEEAGVIESVKAAADLYSPISGVVIEVNHDLVDAPETINDDPYASGWIFKVRPDDEGEFDNLLDADEYEELVDAEDH